MNDEELKSLLSEQISAADLYDQNELAETRIRAMEYYRGVMADTPAQVNRSKTMSHDVADTVNWILPGLMRVFAGSEHLGLYQPLQSNDEAFAEQATQYINHKFWKEWGGYRLLWDAFFDALLLRNGIIKHWWDTSETFETSTHSGLSQLQLTDLVSDDNVEVLQSTEEKGEGGKATFSVKIKRTVSGGRLRAIVIPPEDFLIDAKAQSIDEDEVRFCAHRDVKTRSDLVEMGFDKDIVDQIPDDQSDGLRREKSARHDDELGFDQSSDPSMQAVEIFECYLKADVDGDGIAERIRAYMAGGEDGTLLDWEIWDDDLPFTDFVVNRVPHRFEGRSIADETLDIQQIKTVLIRQAVDNTYGHNNPQKEVEKGSVLNPEQLTNPKFGGIIHKKAGSAPIVAHSLAYTADKSFMALDYFDQMIEKRTGVSRSTMSLDPDALQNQTATAVQASKDSAYSKIELMARNLAEMGFKRLFKMLLRLVVKHQDRPDIIRLRDEFVEMDPRHWNAHMDVTIDVGLGTGSRDRDMGMLGSILSNQIMLTDRMSGAGFSQEAISMMPKIRNTLIKQAECAGIKSPDSFYPEVSSEVIEKLQEQAADKNITDPKLEVQVRQHNESMKLRMEELKLTAQLRREQMQTEVMLRREQLAAQMAAQNAGPVQNAPINFDDVGFNNPVNTDFKLNNPMPGNPVTTPAGMSANLSGNFSPNMPSSISGGNNPLDENLLKAALGNGPAGLKPSAKQPIGGPLRKPDQ